MEINHKIINLESFQYAGLLTRVKASLIDTLIIVLWIIFVPSILFKDSESSLRIFLMVFPVILYEPLMITLFGCTIGQKIFGIKVVSEKDMSKCPLYLSFIRTITKYILGFFSFIYILFSDKKKAIHDNIANTIVILNPDLNKKDANLVDGNETSEYDTINYIYPSGLRRFIFFLIWYIFSLFIFGLILNLILALFFHLDFADENNLPKPLKLVYTILSISVLIFTLSLALKGLLPGARRVLKSEIEYP